MHTQDEEEVQQNNSYCVLLSRLGAKTIKKNTNSTQNKSQTHRAEQYKVTSFLSADCDLSTNPCSKNVYSLGPRLAGEKMEARRMVEKSRKEKECEKLE